jgi:hypothetical protein
LPEVRARTRYRFAQRTVATCSFIAATCPTTLLNGLAVDDQVVCETGSRTDSLARVRANKDVAGIADVETPPEEIVKIQRFKPLGTWAAGWLADD